MSTDRPITRPDHDRHRAVRASRADVEPSRRRTTYAEAFATDADFVDIRGVHHIGRPAIAAGHQAHLRHDLSRAAPSATSSTGPARSRPAASSRSSRATLDAPDGPLRGINHARFTLTIAEDDEGWKIDAFHNTLFPPAH